MLLPALSVVLLTLAVPATAHGGAPYRGPGDVVPPMPQQDLADWSVWWQLNGDRYLNLKAKTHAHLVTWDAGGALTGLGNAPDTGPPSLCPTPEQRADMAEALYRLEARWEDRDVDSVAMLALAKLGLQPERARRLFARHLDAPDRWVREAAVLAYGVLGDPAAYPLLRGLLADGEAGRALQGDAPVTPRVRAAAATALALLASGEDTAGLRERIAADLLAGVAAASGPRSEEDPSLSAMASMVALGRMPHGDATRVAARLLDLQREAVLPDAVGAHLPGTLARLLDAAPAGDATAVRACALLLQWTEPAAAHPVALRRAATLALGAVAGRCNADRQRAAFDALVQAATDERDVQARRYSSMALADLAVASREPDLRAQVVTHLVERMQRAATGDRPWAALALGVLAHETRAAATLDYPREAVLAVHAGFLETRAPGSKAAHALALGLMAHSEAGDDLAAALREVADEEFLGHAAVALGLLGASAHKEVLRGQLEDSSRRYRLQERTAVGLALMKDRRVVGALCGLLRDDARWAKLAAASDALHALGQVGDRSAVATLLEIADTGDRTPLHDAFLALALGMLGDERDLPHAARFAEDLDYRADPGLLFDPLQESGLLDLR